MVRILTPRPTAFLVPPLLAALAAARPPAAPPADPTVEFQGASQSAPENGGAITATLVLSAAHTLDVSVPFTLGGSASDPEDYTIDASPVVIPAGSLTVDVTITPKDDALDEDPEGVELTLGTPTNATLGATVVHTATLIDDDPLPAVQFAQGAGSHGEGGAPLAITVQLSAVSGRDVSVPFAVAGTAGDPDDYTVDASPLVISAGSTSGALTVTPLDDGLDEPGETVELTLGPALNADLGATTQHVLTLADDDPAPTVELASAGQSVGEGAGLVTVGLLLSSASGQDVTVPFSVGGSATSPDDYTIDPSPLVIPAGVTSADVTVALVDDDVHEPGEDVVVTLGSPTNAGLGAVTQHTLAVGDDEATPTVAFELVTGSAGESAGSVLVAVSLSGPSSFDVSVPHSHGGSADESDDYTVDAGPLVIPAGATTADLVLYPVPDALHEGDEYVVLDLGPPSHADLGPDATHTLTLTDENSAPEVEFQLASQSLPEGSGAVPVVVLLSAPSGLDVTVPFSVAGTATQPDDYSVDASPLVIPAGATSGDIVVALVDDGLHEPNETVELSLGPPTNATLGAVTVHTLTLANDDALPTVEFTLAAQAVDEDSGAALVTAALSSVASVDVTVPLTVSGTAQPSTDFGLSANPLVIPQGALSADLSVSIVSDTLDEPDETVVLTMGAPTGADLGATIVHTLTLTDDDAPPAVGFALPRTFAGEADGPLALDVVLDAPSGLDVTLGFGTGGDAVDGLDYLIDPSPLVIPAGQVAGAIGVTLLDDLDDEDAERILVKLHPNPTNAVLSGIQRHRVNIRDDDGIGTEEDIVGLRTSVQSHVFERRQVGDLDGPLVVTVQNVETIPLVFRGVAFDGDHGGDFLVSYPGGVPVALDPGDMATFEVSFAPTQNGLRFATARVKQTPGGAPPGTVRLSGPAIGPEGAEVTVNAAPEEYVDLLGGYWAVDYGHVGTSGHIATVAQIVGTADDDLYRTARAGRSFGYAFPLPNGQYDVSFHAAEIQKTGAGQRVFDVLMEGALVLDDLDLLVTAGANAAFVSAPQRVTVADGLLNVDLVSSAGEALVAALEVRSVPILETDQRVLDFGVVDQGFFQEKVLTVTNTGLNEGHATQLGFVLGAGSEGTGNDFYVRIGNTDYYGGVSSVYHAIDLTFPAGQATPVSVFFEPTEHKDNRFELTLDGDFPTLSVDVIGTGGSDAGWGFLHPVLDTDRSLVVDYDGNQREVLELLGSESHTHEPGQTLAAWEWRVNGNPVASTADASHQFLMGSSIVELEIWDDKVPADSASDSMTVTVHPVDQVPGILCQYYDGSQGGAAALLDAVPTRADYVERIPGLLVEAQDGAVGSSPFASEVMVRWNARFDVPVAETYDFLAIGGVGRRVEVDGLPWSGPAQLAPGLHDLEARFAVPTLADTPLTLRAYVAGQVELTFQEGLVHDEAGVVPVIHSMPSVGTELGGNLITIRGFGFFPKQNTRVLWGGIKTFKQADFVSWTDEQIELVSPPGTGTVKVTVITPGGQSNPKDFTYSPDGPVPIKFNRLDDRKVGLPGPTTATFHPNGKLYVGLIDGRVAEMEFDENWFLEPPGVTFHPGVSGLTNSDLLGLWVNPYDDPAGPVKLYVGHGEHWLNGGGSFAGPSPYTGQVSILTGPGFDTPVTLIDQLPVSNHDHGINGGVFDHNGDLLVCVGGNTNAGIRWPLMGDLPESPLSGAIVKAETSRPDFNGSIVYLDRDTGVPVDDQVLGESVEVAPGVHVSVHAAGVRNAYDLVLTTWGYVYCTDNGPNWNYGYGSTGPNTDTGYHVQGNDEVNLVEAGGYYGGANRARGLDDPRQDLYRFEWEASDAQFTQRIWEVDSSTNGMEEYRSSAFGGQIRGRLLAQKWNDNQYMLELAPDRRSVVDAVELQPFTKGLDVVNGPGGTILVIDYSGNQIQLMEPDDLAAVGLTVYDVTPWRATESGGTPFVIGGEGFVPGQTSVTIGGVPASLTQVTPRRIRGVFPPLPPNNVGALYDVTVTASVDTVTLAQAALILPAQAGEMKGFWTTGATMPDPLGEVACAVIGRTMYVFGEGSAKSYAYDLVAGTWRDDLAPRPHPGNHHACEVVNGKVWLFGGLGFSSEGKVQVYDPASDSWATKTPMPWAGGSCGSALIGGKVYVCGGIVGNSTVNNLARYDPATDSWTAGLAPMPVGVNHAASASDGARLWVFGGRQGGNWPQPGFDTVQVYDPATGQWDSSSQGQSQLTPMPAGRGGTGRAVLLDGELYVFGGEEPGVFDEVFVYRAASNTWRAEELMPTARHGIFPVRYQNRIFVAGGGTSAGFSASDVLEVFQRP